MRYPYNSRIEPAQGCALLELCAARPAKFRTNALVLTFFSSSGGIGLRNIKTACLLALLLFPMQRNSLGCICLDKWPSVRDAYISADGVFVGTVTKVEESIRTQRGQSLLDLDNKTTFFSIKEWKMYIRIEKIYKGDLQTEIILSATESSCTTKFDVGSRLLLYATYSKEAGAWGIDWACGRSKILKPENDDISFLEGLPQSLERTRLSGYLQRYEPDGPPPDSRPLPDIKIRIAGEKETRELITDNNGHYEIYDLLADAYTVTPEIPKGLKLRRNDGNKSVKVNLSENKCIALDFAYNADNQISGKILDVDGKPLKDVCLGLIRPEDEKSERIRSVHGCSKEDGSYVLKDVPPGKFLLAANPLNRISRYEPFPRLYYPNAFDKKTATILSMEEGDIRENIDIRVPSQSGMVTFSGVFLYSDGKPVANQNIEFTPDSKQEGVDGVSRTLTDSQGRFSLQVLKGLSGKLYGKILAYIGKYKSCPEIDELIRQGGKKVGDAKTQAMQIIADKDIQGIELKYSFPECKEAAPPVRFPGMN
jgi:hypothetical protein